jgi:hypothetical protein
LRERCLNANCQQQSEYETHDETPFLPLSLNAAGKSTNAR